MENLDVNDIATPENISLLFRLSMWWRIFYGLVRIVLGFILLKLVGSSFADILKPLMDHEVSEDPTDVVFQFIHSILNDHSFTVTYFVASYLLFWGAVDIILSFFLLRHMVRTFPIAIGLIALFICYGIFRLTHTHSLILLTVIIIDIGILFLINFEYKRLKAKLR